jgi:class 3 adenylate cyclase/tetratricopeptide (TPR) repeat protein
MPVERRKTVTVVFCDLVDSTPLGARLGAETYRTVQTSWFAEAEAALTAHGGVVEKFIGDAVMAVFGIPETHEDDALRAVRAAFELRERMRALGDALEERVGARPVLRTGIATGEVVTTGVEARDRLVTGDTVATAKRLEEATPAGEIAIGEITAALVRGAAELEDLGRLEAKGKPEGIRAWRVVALDPAADGVSRNLETPLVDRVAELGALEALVHDAAKSRRTLGLTLIGSPGIGKSRLLAELERRKPGGVLVLTGRSVPYGDGATWWPLVVMLRSLGGERAVEDALSSAADRAEVLARLQSAVGSGDAEFSNDEIFWSVRRLVETLARERPLVVCLDDAQWAEPAFHDLLDYLHAFVRELPVAIVRSGRPELAETRPGPPGWGLVELEPLGDEDADALLRELDASDDRREAIAAAAEGNPLFLEQLAAMAAELPGAELGVPPSIDAVLAARLDQLEPVEQQVVERASVLGGRFERRSLSALVEPSEQDAVGRTLLALVRRRLLRPDGERGDDAYRFAHGLVREAAYARITHALRADLHERAARRIEVEEPSPVRDELVAFHLERAHESLAALGLDSARTAAIAGEAAGWLLAAGRRAFARDDMPAAATLFARAAALLPPGDAQRLEALCNRALALWEAGLVEDGAAALTLLHDEASAAGDDRLVALAELEQIVHEQLGGIDVEAVELAARRVIASASEVGDDVSVARAWRRLSAAHRRAGAYSAGEEAARHALTHAQAAANRQEEARAADALCNCLLYGPTPAPEALDTCHELLAIPARTRTLDASVMGVAAGLEAMLGLLDTARETYGRAAAIFEELGLDLARAALTQIGIPIALAAGEVSEAEREARTGAEILSRFGSASLQSPLIAEVLYVQGRIEDAASALADSASEPLPEIVQWHVRKGIVETRLAIAQGQPEQAMRTAESAVQLARATEDPTLQGDALAAYADALRHTDRRDEADAAIETARSLYVAKGNVAAAEALAPVRSGH